MHPFSRHSGPAPHLRSRFNSKSDSSFAGGQPDTTFHGRCVVLRRIRRSLKAVGSRRRQPGWQRSKWGAASGCAPGIRGPGGARRSAGAPEVARRQRRRRTAGSCALPTSRSLIALDSTASPSTLSVDAFRDGRAEDHCLSPAFTRGTELTFLGYRCLCARTSLRAVTFRSTPHAQRPAAAQLNARDRRCATAFRSDEDLDLDRARPDGGCRNRQSSAPIALGPRTVPQGVRVPDSAHARTAPGISSVRASADGLCLLPLGTE